MYIAARVLGLANRMICNFYNFTSGTIPTETFRCEGKIRYAAIPSPCSVRILGDDKMEVEFDKAQRAITPGQSVVFYDGTRLIGGGIIEQTV